MSDKKPNDATVSESRSIRPTRVPRTLPFSLLGQIVYDKKSPIARIHNIKAPHNDGSSDADDPIKGCLVSGCLDHVEFDLSTLEQVISYTLNAYPKGCGLTNGLNQETQGSDFFSEADLVEGSQLLTERCGFVGEILDIGRNGHCIRSVDAFSKRAFWDVIKSFGRVAAPSRRGSLHLDSSHLSPVSSPTVGRIIVVETLSPEVLVALHTALEYYFVVTASIDIYAGYARLGSEVPFVEMIRRTKYRARHYSIDFLYVVTHEERLKLSRWHKQRTSLLYGEEDKYPAEFYIGRGTTAMQLSEELDRGKSLPPNVLFRPWSALVIPGVPDFRPWREHRLPTEVRLANALEAWLWIISQEHRFVYAHMRNLFQRISDKVSPPSDFMFNLSHIDTLLFDDKNYTKSKLYLWAYQSLEMVQSMLKNIIAQWDVYRMQSDIFSTGLTSPAGKETYGPYIQRVENIAKETDNWMGSFKSLIEDCKAKQSEIVALRDGLFNGSAVLESRNSYLVAEQSFHQSKVAIAQGENIKVLTLVSIFFLPLAFVTSIFGMTNLPQNVNMNAFAIALVCFCIPAYVIIGSIMNEQGMAAWRTVIQWLKNFVPQRWKGPRRGALGNLVIGLTHIANWDALHDNPGNRAANPTKPSKDGYTTNGGPPPALNEPFSPPSSNHRGLELWSKRTKPEGTNQKGAEQDIEKAAASQTH